MELVTGEDLSDRLKRGPVPADETLELARQVATALEEAHEKGIVHRDLKPANIKVTPDGKVKVLDFGLAKAWAGDGASVASAEDLSHSPTLARTGTQAGVILGTAGYMSPEQARGRPVDKRADIWAFGVVLYEMLSGRRLFEGETVTDVLASVVKDPIDWAALPKDVPAALRSLLARCLERDPRKRLRDIGDARLEIEHALGELDGVAQGDLQDAGAELEIARDGTRDGERRERIGQQPAPTDGVERPGAGEAGPLDVAGCLGEAVGSERSAAPAGQSDPESRHMFPVVPTQPVSDTSIMTPSGPLYFTSTLPP